MSTTPLDTTPYWSSSASSPAFAPLSDDIETDVLVVGAGVTGLTAAARLVDTGRRVTVVDRGRCASIDSGHTTAHLSMVTDTRLSALVEQFGRDHAQAVWDAGIAAIAHIDDLVRTHGIDADFARVDGFLHTPIDETRRPSGDRLEDEAGLARELGFDAEYVASAPVVGQPAVRFPDQARIHPRKYLAALATRVAAAGGRIHEHSAVDAFTAEPRAATINGHTVRCEDVVIATHDPIAGLASSAAASMLQTKLALYTSYVVAGRIARGTIPDALWWDTADPYDYVRIEPHGDHDVVIFGGADHKTGQEPDTVAAFDQLEARFRTRFPTAEVTHHWSGQVIETPDGLPYIGRTADHQYAATGYAGNGMTFGTLAGMMLADAILEHRNPWAELFDPSRKALAHGLWDYVKENADYPYYFIRSRFTRAEAQSLRSIARGEGRVIERGGEKVAASCGLDGSIALRSAICTHMGCVVAWNAAERTWDCPCHGSRFTPAGEVISGPAETPLPEAD
jgi:glycine/D-amino acid oxidase-like deaminating enzyme/nitrite reductase/ring-hydroxylating ferredoxin subunit